MAGAEGDMIAKAVALIVESGDIRFPKAQEIVNKLKEG
jgi:hypothetical protein